MTPFCSAWKAPMAMGSSKNSRGVPDIPMEMEITSTPSLSASSMACKMASPEQPVGWAHPVARPWQRAHHLLPYLLLNRSKMHWSPAHPPPSMPRVFRGPSGPSESQVSALIHRRNILPLSTSYNRSTRINGHQFGNITVLSLFEVHIIYFKNILIYIEMHKCISSC